MLFKKKLGFLCFLVFLLTIYEIWCSLEVTSNTTNDNQYEWRMMMTPHPPSKTQGYSAAVLDFVVSPSKQETNRTNRTNSIISEVPVTKFKYTPDVVGLLKLVNSEFPVTKFTPNVMGLLKLVSLKRVKECAIQFHISVNDQGMVYAIQCHPPNNAISLPWCKVLHDLFSDSARRPLPGNGVAFGMSDQDYTDPKIRKNRGCFASSSPGGRFAVPNFLDILEMAKHTSYHPITIPWQKRSRIPIWRGTLWQKGDLNMTDESSSTTTILEELSRQTPRAKAVLFAKQRPDLLNARISSKRGFLDTRESEKRLLWEHNATNGLHRLLPLDWIPAEQYYTQHQVALVLGTFGVWQFAQNDEISGVSSFDHSIILVLTSCILACRLSFTCILGGIGASFRTSTHLSTATAVILQAYSYEEWFTKQLIAWEHYIPLAEDLSNLNETLHWVRTNPNQVRDIAIKGHEFYLDFLSFQSNQDHIYELLYRMSLLYKSKGIVPVYTE
jgi:hypothetical protein